MACWSHGVHGEHEASLFCLSAETRSRIYLETGLVNNCRRVHLTPPRHRLRGESIDAVDRPLLRELRFSLGLMRTCRAIYEETSRIFYSTNRFVAQYLDDPPPTDEEASSIHYNNIAYMIRFLDDSRLFALGSLRPQSIGHLTHLTLYLNVTRCKSRDPYPKHSGQSWEWADWWKPNEGPLSSTSDRDQTLISRWSEVAQHLAANVTPSSLHLCLGCDVADKATAMLVLTPLFQWPRLASCVIRLHQSINTELQDLAGHVVAHLTGAATVCDRSQFPFLSLPRELRLYILQYTDLVTPLCEVTWTRELGYHTKFLSWRPNACRNGDGGRWMSAARFRSCYQASIGCFCPNYHAVFPTTCNCWSPPAPLFLVCKLIKADAEEVFFRMNRVVVLHSGGKHFVATHTPAQLEASFFLKSVMPPRNLASIRFLELSFPPFEDDYLQTTEPAYQDWIETIDHLQAHMNLSRLTLRIYMRDQIPAWFGRLEVPFRANMTKEKCTSVVQVYCKLLHPLQKLKGLHRLFVHLAVPHERPISGILGARWPGESDKKERFGAALEQKFEKRVMGGDYDSVQVGKYQLANSQWRTDEMSDVVFRGRWDVIRNYDVAVGSPERPSD